MTDKFSSVISDSIRVAVAAWAAIWLEPWVENNLPALGTPIRYLIAVVMSALVVEALRQLLFGMPSIEVTWMEKQSKEPISEIVAKVREFNKESQTFCVRISVPQTGWLGHKFLQFLFRSEVKLLIQIDKASLIPYREDCSKIETVPAFIEANASNGFEISMGNAPRLPGPWHYADVRWTNRSTPHDEKFNVEYIFHQDKALKRFILNLMVLKKTNIQHFRVTGA